jgi:leader peptidase (prepilin peptidase)/N-methyltransferase
MAPPATSRYRPRVRLILIVVGALWGAWSGLLLPRAAHRLAVEAEAPWNGQCPDGHPITGTFAGWLGRARCTDTTGSYGPSPSLRPPTPADDDSPAAPETTSPAPCGPYGPSTPAVSIATALVCAALAAATGPRPELVVWLLAAPVAVLLALVDYRVHRLPDVLTLPLAAVTLALLGIATALPADAGSWLTALLGGLALGAAYLVLYLINPAGMGFGDVKLALALGAALGWYGWPVLVTGAFAGVLYGAMYGLGMVALRRAGRKTAIPLGPFMLGGAFTGLLLGAFAVA